MTGGAQRRVLLVDDDAAIRRLVELALEDHGVDLVCCADGAEALAALCQAPARLVITDLMMPGVDGWTLLRRLSDEPSLRAGAKLAVFSAGLNATVRERLAGLPVWRLIDKPTSVMALAELVESAIAPDQSGDDDARTSSGNDLTGAAREASAIAEHFGGDEGLYRAFRSHCRQQFPSDLAQGDAALAAADATALHRLAHSLKSVLQLLGHDDAGATARQLERAAEASDLAACTTLWQHLRHCLEDELDR